MKVFSVSPSMLAKRFVSAKNRGGTSAWKTSGKKLHNVEKYPKGPRFGLTSTFARI